MGSMVMSTFMMFVPWHVEFIFLTILCVGFFGIYIPYNESKKKGEVWAPLGWLKKLKPSGNRTRRRGSARIAPDRASTIGSGKRHRLEQLESLKGAGLLTDQEYKEKRQEILKEL